MKVCHSIISALVIVLLFGCAGYSPSPDIVGQDRTTLSAGMGQPEREYEVDGFTVLHYPRGPAGSHTYFVYLGNDSRVVKWEQVLTEDRFNAIDPGIDTVRSANYRTRIGRSCKHVGG